MMKVVRIICIWMYCICCLCGHTQLPTVAAIPYEYFDEHEQLNYDLETEQSKAKYDSHLLAQQLKKDSNYDNDSLNNLNKKSFEHNNDLSDTEQDMTDDVDFEPRARAASCYTNGKRYNHGQKVPRIDKCEVCLCMDGEIFCWWEKCDDKKTIEETKELQKEQQSTATYSKSWQTIETSTQTNSHNTYEKQQRQHQQSYNEHQRKPTDEHQMSSEQQSWQKLQPKMEHKANSKKTKNNKNVYYEKSYLKPTKATEPEMNIDYYEQQQPQQQQEHLQTQKQHLMLEHKSISQSNKIFNFPENLPSVLYYDYRTEEHQHHQHQHHQQHLKHQHELEEENSNNSNNNNNNKKNSDSIMTYKQQQSTTSAHLLSKDNNAENGLNTDSDILPEPPTKKPRMTTLTILNVNESTTVTTTSMPKTTTTTTYLKGDIKLDDSTYTTQNDSIKAAVKHMYMKEKRVIGTEGEEQQQQQQQQQQEMTNAYEFDNSDEAFHRWLTSSITNQNNNETYEKTNNTATTIILSTTEPALDVWPNVNVDTPYLHNDTRLNSSTNIGSSSSSSQTDSGTGIVDIDILLTASDDNQAEMKQLQAPKQEILEQWQKAQQQHQQQQTQEQPHQESNPIILESDHLLTNNQAALKELNILSTVTTEPERHCNVMGTLYKIGAVLPQDSGNCLQCVCIEDASADHTPRVTCSPHNCPPLVLPDFLDATGY